MAEQEERPTKFPKLDTSIPLPSSDLMARVSSFLPQIQQANERMLQQQQEDDEGNNKIDAKLKKDTNSDDGSDEDSSSSSSNESDRSSSSEEESNDEPEAKAKPKSGQPKVAPPTIELKIALGNVDDNPAIEWLANQDRPEADTDGVKKDGNDDNPESRSRTFVRSMLAGEPANNNNQSLGLTPLQHTQKKRKGPLITEVD